MKYKVCHTYLQGSVLDSAVEVLLHRLRGLCDNVDAGPETFDDQEVCFSLRDPNQQVSCKFKPPKSFISQCH